MAHHKSIIIKKNIVKTLILTEKKDTDTTYNITLQKNSKLTLINIKNNIKSTDHTNIILAENSSLNCIYISLPKETIENHIQVDLNGKNANCKLNSLSIVNKENKIINKTLINHNFSESTSDQLFKNILNDHSYSEFSGLIHIKRHAQKTKANQLNKNLLLSDTAKSIAKPQLKIQADNVKCAHGSSTGQINQDELFYLQSRGLTIKQAKTMLIMGFAKEIIDFITIKKVKKSLEKLL
jgi:Fe-S cluster assembly protein SufD